jgi:hypothetical protein
MPLSSWPARKPWAGKVIYDPLLRAAGLDEHIEILQMRKGLWTAVAQRLHTPQRVFPFGPGASEVMINGTVEYTLKDGRKASVGLSGCGGLDSS